MRPSWTRHHRVLLAIPPWLPHAVPAYTAWGNNDFPSSRQSLRAGGVNANSSASGNAFLAADDVRF